MVFSTIIFLLRFLPITLALYYLAPPKLKNTVLFLCSLELTASRSAFFTSLKNIYSFTSCVPFVF